ncbi:MAG: hypothetical protein RL708_1138 [Bacteroidota bacterium]|jgi:hypothetical protein
MGNPFVEIKNIELKFAPKVLPVCRTQNQKLNIAS